MDHPVQHSCTDLSVYCYLLNSLPIATLLLPCYKPALLFFFSFIPCCFLLLCWSLNYSPPFPLIPFFELSGFIQICFLSGFTSLFWFDPGYSAETCKQTGLKKPTVYTACMLFHWRKVLTVHLHWKLFLLFFYWHWQNNLHLPLSWWVLSGRSSVRIPSVSSCYNFSHHIYSSKPRVAYLERSRAQLEIWRGKMCSLSCGLLDVYDL